MLLAPSNPKARRGFSSLVRCLETRIHVDPQLEADRLRVSNIPLDNRGPDMENRPDLLINMLAVSGSNQWHLRCNFSYHSSLVLGTFSLPKPVSSISDRRWRPGRKNSCQASPFWPYLLINSSKPLYVDLKDCVAALVYASCKRTQPMNACPDLASCPSPGLILFVGPGHLNLSAT
jgi:hypothetical protein